MRDLNQFGNATRHDLPYARILFHSATPELLVPRYQHATTYNPDPPTSLALLAHYLLHSIVSLGHMVRHVATSLVVVDMADHSLAIDHEGDALHLLAGRGRGAELEPVLPVIVNEQAEGQAELGRESLV